MNTRGGKKDRNAETHQPELQTGIELGVNNLNLAVRREVTPHMQARPLRPAMGQLLSPHPRLLASLCNANTVLPRPAATSRLLCRVAILTLAEVKPSAFCRATGNAEREASLCRNSHHQTSRQDRILPLTCDIYNTRQQRLII